VEGLETAPPPRKMGLHSLGRRNLDKTLHWIIINPRRRFA